MTFLLRPSPKLARKQGKVYRSSKHKRRGYLGGVRYQNVVLSKYLSLCTCNYPFYSTYKSLIHRVNFGQLKLSTDIEKNPAPSVYVDATKTIHAPYCQRNVVVFGEMRDNNVSHFLQDNLCLCLQNCQKCVQRLSDFSSFNTVKVILVTCTVMPELRGITTVCHLKHSWL